VHGAVQRGRCASISALRPLQAAFGGSSDWQQRYREFEADENESERT
jgi:hypothetical protein